MRRRGGEEEQATDIKSNNPHLAGGEKAIENGHGNNGFTIKMVDLSIVMLYSLPEGVFCSFVAGLREMR